MKNPDPAFVCTDVGKRYADGETTVEALCDVSLTGHLGQVIAVVGPSGSGKTTLLHLIGGSDYADSGSVFAAGIPLESLSTSERADFRASFVSQLFSDSNLLPVLTAYENVMLGLSLLRLPEPEKHHRATEALERVGLKERQHRRPSALSSGERQRTAVARALARRAPIVIADEPTAHLDHELAAEITRLLVDLSHDVPSCIVVATHDAAVADFADRVVRLRDGRLLE